MEERIIASGLTRREFVKAALAGTAAIALSSAGSPSTAWAQKTSPFGIPRLPYAEDALAPVISAKTVGFHYGKHHLGYLYILNDLVQNTPYEKMSLEEIIKATAGVSGKTPVFNAAAQVWNHTFYWHGMKAGGGGRPGGEIGKRIEKDLGSYENFRKEFVGAALGQFGSGWAWLATDGKSLKVVKTPNAENPITQGLKPLLTIDVWEHAYYLDYQNRRKDFVEASLDKLVNWAFVEKNLLG
jgi:Fe-Mn family superoxide dismutase